MTYDMNDRAIEHAGLDPWEIRAHLKRLGHDPAARLIRQLCDALPAPSRSVGETAPGRVVMKKASPMTMVLKEVAEDAQASRSTWKTGRAVEGFAFPKPNFGPGVEEGE
jgi:hypothetical protein